ncbi:MAG: hypothetical protein IT262_10105 [Saprospiraceae bacterium]|nr:hypothetical protein [Saprospiraceae bacterium]
MMAAKPPLTNLQLELLKLYAHQLPEEQLFEIKLLLGRYFAQKATDAMQKTWQEQQLSPEDMKKWANEHHRIKSSH